MRIYKARRLSSLRWPSADRAFMNYGRGAEHYCSEADGQTPASLSVVSVPVCTRVSLLQLSARERTHRGVILAVEFAVGVARIGGVRAPERACGIQQRITNCEARPIYRWARRVFAGRARGGRAVLLRG
jgi:hypothetical protein